MADAPSSRKSPVLWIALVSVFLAGVTYVVVRNREIGVDSAQTAPPPPTRAIDLDSTRAKAVAGSPVAQNRLGEAYLRGSGVDQDFQEAVNWLRLAGDQGHAGAQNNLGMLYEAGQGVPTDYKTASEWYRKAAEQGHVDAEYNLASMYVYARGVPRDDAEALKWLSRAASRGDGLASLAMGERHLSGVGVPRDPVEAFKWLSLASAAGVEDAGLALAELQGRLSPEEIEQGQQRLAAFQPAAGWMEPAE